MRNKKQIVSIMTLAVLLILMMSTAIQAVSLVGNISDFNVSMNGSQMKLTWASVSNSAGYNVYVNGTKIGSVYSNEASLINFSEDTTYRLRIAAYDSRKVEVATSNEISFTTTQPKTLDQVKNLTVTQVNGYVTLNWEAVNNADKYQVFVDVPGFGNMNIGEVTTTNAMLQGFSNGMRYGFSIRACKTLNSENVSYGEKSVAKYITIDVNKDDTANNNNNPTNPDRVTNITTYDITETTATVTWAEVSNADGYDVLLSKNYGSYQTVISKEGNRVALSNLTPNSYYRVKVIAYKVVNNKKVYGDESTYASFTTKEEKIVVGNVTTVYVDSLTQNSANISWTAVSGVTGYNIYFAQGNGTYQYKGSTTNRSYAFSNLQSNTSYKVKVEAYKLVNGKEYTSQTATVKSFTTSKETLVKPATVTHLTAEIRNRNEAYLVWWPVEGATGYEVEISKNGGAYQRVTYVAENHTILTSSMLDYSTNYQVRVRAYKNQWTNVSAGKYETIYGNYSSATSFRTESYVKAENNTSIAKVTGLKSTVKGTTVSLSWNKVSGAAGYEIDFYVPFVGHIPFYTDTNYRDITGVIGKDSDYTARVRAYKYINGVKTYGPYSDEVRFREN